MGRPFLLSFIEVFSRRKHSGAFAIRETRPTEGLGETGQNGNYLSVWIKVKRFGVSTKMTKFEKISEEVSGHFDTVKVGRIFTK